MGPLISYDNAPNGFVDSLAEMDEPEAEDAEGDTIKMSLSHLSAAFGAWARESALEPEVLSLVMKTGINFQLQQLHAFKELMAERNKEVKELTKIRSKLAEHKAMKQAGKTETKGSMMKKGRPLDAAIEEETQLVTQLTEAVKCRSGCLYAHEFDRFDAERSEQCKAHAPTLVAPIGRLHARCVP